MVTSRISCFLLLAALTGLTACASPPTAAVPLPCVAAARTLPRGYCADATAQDRAAVLNRLPRPLTVEPLHHEVTVGKLPARSVLLGASIVLPAAESLSAAWLRRVLTCHQADVALGQIQASPDDPFSEPSAWLSISAQPQGGTLIVRVAPSEEAQAGAVLDHATRWAVRPAAKP